jgi:hypothetical protein
MCHRFSSLSQLQNPKPHQSLKVSLPLTHHLKMPLLPPLSLRPNRYLRSHQKNLKQSLPLNPNPNPNLQLHLSHRPRRNLRTFLSLLLSLMSSPNQNLKRCPRNPLQSPQLSPNLQKKQHLLQLNALVNLGLRIHPSLQQSLNLNQSLSLRPYLSNPEQNLWKNQHL